MLSMSSLMEERMLWSLTSVFLLWYFSNRGLFAGLKHTALTTLSLPRILQLKYLVGENVAFLTRDNYGLNVAHDFLYFRVLRSYKTGKVRVMSFNAKSWHVLIIGQPCHSF